MITTPHIPPTKIYIGDKDPGDRTCHEAIVYPFWGPNDEDPSDPDRGRFDQYAAIGTQYFQPVSLEQSDVAVLPWPWQKRGERGEQFLTRVQRSQKPIVIFFNSDSDERISVPNSVVFRTSFHHSTKRHNEFAVPGWSEDFLQHYFNGALPLSVRSTEVRPTVSYCGYGGSWKTVLRQTLHLRVHPGEMIRSKALKRLQEHKAVSTEFLIRDGFWAGAFRTHQHVPRTQLRREYVNNMASGDYVLCSRGGGNFSYRLYETLSLGRIPVFINTDCVLPYDQFIDWKHLLVWVEDTEVNCIADKVLAYHDSLSSDQFIERQQQLRAIWEEWISPQGFFKNLHRCFTF